jgi:hypothetical protein
MPMEQKAYAFDWSRFVIDLLPLLVEALPTNRAAELEMYIDPHLVG